MNKIILRDYQKDAVDAVFEDFNKGIKSTIIDAAVGAGKSLMIGECANRINLQGKKALILHHNATLCQQNFEKYNLLGKGQHTASIVSAKLRQRDYSGDSIFATIGSVMKKCPENIGLVMIDECHKVNKKQGQFRELIKHYGVPLIGFSGTPWRLGEGEIYGKKNSLFEKVSYKIGIDDLTEKGFLSPITLPREGLMKIDFSGISINKSTKDYDIGDIVAFYQKQIKVILPDFLEKSKDRTRVFVFCPSVLFCQTLKGRMAKEGIEAEIITGKTPQEERNRIISLVKEGKLKFVLSVETMTTGVDCPPLDCIVALRPTTSSALYIQMVGRGLRISPTTRKTDCLLLDYSNWIRTHGFPEDACSPDEAQSGKRKKRDYKRCPNCGEQNKLTAEECSQCKEKFPRKPRVAEYTSAVDKDGAKKQVGEFLSKFSFVNPSEPLKQYERENGGYGYRSDIWFQGKKRVIFFPIGCGNRWAEKTAKDYLTLFKEGLKSKGSKGELTAYFRVNPSGFLNFLRFPDLRFAGLRFSDISAPLRFDDD